MLYFGIEHWLWMTLVMPCLPVILIWISGLFGIRGVKYENNPVTTKKVLKTVLAGSWRLGLYGQFLREDGLLGEGWHFIQYYWYGPVLIRVTTDNTNNMQTPFGRGNKQNNTAYNCTLYSFRYVINAINSHLNAVPLDNKFRLYSLAKSNSIGCTYAEEILDTSETSSNIITSHQSEVLDYVSSSLDAWDSMAAAGIKQRETIFLHGEGGTGKSQIGEMIARKFNAKYLLCNASDLINNYTSLDSIFRNIDQKEKEIFVLQIDEFDEWFKQYKSNGGFYRMPNGDNEEEEQLAVPRDKIHEFLDLSGNLRFVNRCVIILTSNYREKIESADPQIFENSMRITREFKFDALPIEEATQVAKKIAFALDPKITSFDIEFSEAIKISEIYKQVIDAIFDR